MKIFHKEMAKRVTAPKRTKTSTKPTAKKQKYAMAKPISGKHMQRRGLGNFMRVTLTYADTDTLNPGVLGVAAEQVWAISSIYDPDKSSVGHQPNMHDSLAQLWERYQVYRVDFHLEFLNTDTSNGQRVGYRLNDTSTGVTDPLDGIENGNSEWTHLSRAGGGKDTCSFTGTVNIPDVHGITYSQFMSNDDYGANFGLDPVENAYLICWSDGLGTDSGAVTLTSHFVFHTKLMGSRFTSQS